MGGNHLAYAIHLLMDAYSKSTGKEKSGDEIQNIITQTACGSAVAGGGLGAIPFVGPTLSMVADTGLVVSMFVRINTALDLAIGEGMLKGVVSAIGSLVAGELGAIAANTALSLIPGIGTIGSMVGSGAACYAITVGQAYVYMKILTDILRAGKDPSKMKAEDFKTYAEKAAKEDDLKSVLKEAKSGYKDAKKAG